jgi:NTE family protein
MMQSQEKHIDLVLEGGGVKGIAFVGALRALDEGGYTFRRIAGTSAGAMIGALIAAGYSPRELEVLIRDLSYRRFADESFLDKLGPFGKSLSLLFEKGIYEGRFTRELISRLLAAKGVRTFGDLRHRSPASSNIEAQYRLVVLVTDISRGRLVRLPWDYHEYGLNPDTQEVADAVAASATIPFYYEPARLGKSYVVDGGVISNFPIWIFEGDRHNHCTDWPTFGIKLSGKPEALEHNLQHNTSNTLSYAFSVLRTVLSAQDQIHLDDPCTVRRTIFVDSGDIKTTDFDISQEEQNYLYNEGVRSAERFLRRWDFQKFLHSCPSRPAATPPSGPQPAHDPKVHPPGVHPDHL